MNTSLKYSVQIIKEQDQLTEALSLRYKVYKKVYPRFFKEDVTQNYESDEFDERSIHLGLYFESDSVKKLAGYCRLILPQYFISSFCNVVVKNHPLYLNIGDCASIEKVALNGLPVQDRQTINSFCNSLEMQKLMYAETSRFIIEEEHRNISLSSFFVLSMWATYELLNIKYSFFSAFQHHIVFYKRFGLTLFPSIASYDTEAFGPHVIFGTDMAISNSKQTFIKELKLELEAEKEIKYRRAA